MNEDFILQTNCSEACFRIKIEKNNWNEQTAFIFKSEAYKAWKKSGDCDENIKTLNDFNIYISDNSSEYTETIFNGLFYTIRGDFPYNNGECLSTAAEKLNLKWEANEE